MVLKTVHVATFCLLSGIAAAATGTSNGFRLDFRGMGPWERRVARPTETISYSSTWATNAPANAKAVVKVYPCLKEKPTYIAIDLSGGTNATHYPVTYFNEIPGGSWSDEYKTSKLVLRHIPAGSFIMGGRNTDYPGAVNTNLHMVTITRDFYMGVFEVTQRQWELVMGNRPSAFTNASCYATRPVEQVSYQDLRGNVMGLQWPQTKALDEFGFFGRICRMTGMTGFDLPTEAQWEYACRAGTSTALSSGKNLSSASNAVELAQSARYAFNSGWAVDSYLTQGEGFRWTDFNCTTERGTAKVGSYPPNPWGLYDMEGNVCEIVLDVYSELATGHTDPVGPDCTVSNRRAYRGGAWRFPAWCSNAGYRHSGDLSYTSRPYSCGARLSLQGGDLPDLEKNEVLVDTVAAGSCTWSPMTSGTRYLTHTTMNGVTTEQLLSAWFEVGGSRLSLSANGELVSGVGVTVAGNEPDWSVYYTTDGTEPTTNATPYTGAITLNETTTVRAVAYNAQGVRSEEASATFTLHDALGIAGAVATPRYPWNGKVDVDVELKGDPSLEYLVTLEALDLLGGTNLPVRTVAVGRADPSAPQAKESGGVLNGGCGGQGLPALPPGRHRLVWDAAADIAGDFDFNRVAVTVKATGSHLLAYPKTLELTVAGYTGTEVLTNVPTLVRLSTAISGFSYGDFATTNGADLAFFTPEGQPLPYEIDEWNPNGESLVWVKLPVFANGTRFTCAYGAQSNNQTIKQSNNPYSVWTDYAGVWHMNEPSGTAFDSTEHHLDGIPSCGTNDLADVSQMVAYEKGACGRARVNAGQTLSSATYMSVPSYDALALGGEFVVAGWYKANEVKNFPRLLSRKDRPDNLHGWEIHVRPASSPTNIVVRGASSVDAGVPVGIPSLEGDWQQIVAVFRRDELSVYTNGVLSTSGSIVPATDNGLPLSFGAHSNGDGHFNGQYDEIRLRGGSLSADRIKADYDMIANRGFLRYDPVTASADEVHVRYDPIWTFDSIPAPNPNDEWAPESVYNDIQTVVARGEVENPKPTIRCLTDAWNLEAKLGANVVFSGSSMSLRMPDLGGSNRLLLWAHSDAGPTYRMVTLDYLTGEVEFDNPVEFEAGADVRFISMRADPRAYVYVQGPTADYWLKSRGTDIGGKQLSVNVREEHGSAVCGYFPGGVPLTDAVATRYPMFRYLDVARTNYMAVFHSGVRGTDVKQTVFWWTLHDEVPNYQVGTLTSSAYSCMKNPTGRYVVPMLDGDVYFTVGHGFSDVNVPQCQRVFVGRFDQFNDETNDMRPLNTAGRADWGREAAIAYSKGVAMPDGRRVFLGGVGRDADGRVRMVYDGVSYTNCTFYPGGHPFGAWNRRDITCLLPNGKFCGVDERLGLVVVNPLTGEMYVASDDPVFKVGKMGCQLLPNGRVLIIPYGAENDTTGGLSACGRLYEVDFGFTRSFSLVTLTSPHVRVAEGEPEPSGVKVGLNPNGGTLAEYAKYYPQEDAIYGDLPTPTWSGHVFRGWGLSATATEFVKPTDPVPPNGAVLHAVWK